MYGEKLKPFFLSSLFLPPLSKKKKKGKSDNKALRQIRNIVFRETNRRLDPPRPPLQGW